MSMFAHIDLEQAQVKPTNFTPTASGSLESDAYIAKVKLAYVKPRKNPDPTVPEAMGISFEFDIAGKTHRETFYVTTKEGNWFYMTKGDKPQKASLPGGVIVDDLVLLVTRAPLKKLVTQVKTFKLYDFDKKTEVPTNVDTLVPILDAEIGLVIRQVRKNKQKEVNGKYVDTAEEVVVNEVDTVFDPKTKYTVVEIRDKEPAPKWVDNWVKNNKGITRDKRTIKNTSPAAPASEGNSGTTEIPSLFGK